MSVIVIGIRDGGRHTGPGSGGQLTTQNLGRYNIYLGKRQRICLTNCVTERHKYPST